MSDTQSHKSNEGKPVAATSARDPEYLFRLPDGDLICVTAGPIELGLDYYDSFRLFMGDAREMREVPVAEVMRYRDGGTTVIDVGSEEVGLFVPSGSRSDRGPSWGDQELEELDPSGVRISESATTITLEGLADRDRAPAAEGRSRQDASGQQAKDADRREAISAERAPETPMPAPEQDSGYGY